MLESEQRGDWVALSDGAWASRIERFDLSGICFSGMLRDVGGVVCALLLILLAVSEEAADDVDVVEGGFVESTEGGVGVEDAAGEDALLPLLGLREELGIARDVDSLARRVRDETD